MPVRNNIIPQIMFCVETVEPTGKDGRSWPFLKGSHTKPRHLPESITKSSDSPAGRQPRFSLGGRASLETPVSTPGARRGRNALLLPRPAIPSNFCTFACFPSFAVRLDHSILSPVGWQYSQCQYHDCNGEHYFHIFVPPYILFLCFKGCPFYIIEWLPNSSETTKSLEMVNIFQEGRYLW